MTDVTIVIEDCPRADFTLPTPIIWPSSVTISVSTPITLSASTNTPTPIINGLGICGTGTSTDPFQIWTFKDLEKIGTTGYGLDKYYKLMANIDASPTQDAEYNNGLGWMPIGTTGPTSWTGNFNGNNKTISGLKISRPTTDYIGLFRTSTAGAIYDLTLTDLDITGQNYTGGLIGQAQNTNIHSITASGTVQGSTTSDSVGGIIGCRERGNSPLYNCHWNGTVSGRSRIGGIAGTYSNNSTNSDTYLCTATGTITGVGSDIGGIFGYRHNNTTYDCQVTNITVNGGNYVGGIIGRGYYVHITDCTGTGINITGNATDQIGGIVGYNARSGAVINCNAQGSVSGRSHVGGIAGRINRDYMEGNKTDNCSFTGTLTATGEGLGGIVGHHNGEIHNCIPGPITFNANSTKYVGGIVGHGYYCYITNCSNYNNIASSGNQVGGIVGYNQNAGYIENCLNQAIISGGSDVGGIVGQHDGANNTANSRITSCNVAGSTIIGTASIGGYVGYISEGKVEYCHIDNNVTINLPNADRVGGIVGGGQYYYVQNCTVKNQSITGRDRVGGIAGYKNRSWDTSWDGNVVENVIINGRSVLGLFAGYLWENAEFDYVGTSTVKGIINGTGSYIGGYIGQYMGILQNKTVNEGDIIINASSTSDYVGGLIGYMENGYVQNCTVNMDVNGRNQIGGIVGRIYATVASFNNITFNGTISGNAEIGMIAGYNWDNWDSLRDQGPFTVSGTINATGGNIGALYGSFCGILKDMTISNVTLNTVNTADNIGGVVGYFENGYLQNITSDIDVLGRDQVGGIVGYQYATIAPCTNLTSTGNVSGRSNVGGIFGRLWDNWDSNRTHTGLNYSGQLTGTGDSVGGIIGGLCGSLTNCTCTGTMVYNNNSGQDRGGLVGYVERNNSAIVNCHSTMDVNGRTNIGGLIGRRYAGGNIERCSARGNVTGLDNMGGLIGFLYQEWGSDGKIIKCFAKGNVTQTVGNTNDGHGGLIGDCYADIVNCYATGSVSGYNYVGGLCGNMHAYSLQNSYSKGQITCSQANKGGLVGGKEVGGTVSNNYWDINTSGIATSPVGTGLTTEQMTKCGCEANYSGFDFSTVWEVNSGQNNAYPILRENPEYGLGNMSITPCAPAIFSSNFDIFTPEISCDAIIDMETCESELSLNKPGISYGTKTESEPIKAQYEIPTSQITNGQGTTITSAIADSTYSTPASETGCGATTEVEVCATFYEIPEPHATTPPSQVYRYTFIFEPRPTYRFIIEPKKILQFIMEDQE